MRITVFNCIYLVAVSHINRGLPNLHAFAFQTCKLLHSLQVFSAHLQALLLWKYSFLPSGPQDPCYPLSITSLTSLCFFSTHPSLHKSILQPALSRKRCFLFKLQGMCPEEFRFYGYLGQCIDIVELYE